MISPLAEFANATVHFPVPIPGTYLDNLGNVCPNKTTYIFDAFLKVEKGKTAVSTEYYPGVDATARSLHGYCFRYAAPFVLPDNVQTEAWYHAVFGKDSGYFYLRSFTRFGGEAIDRMIEVEIGTYITGFFQTQKTP